jgi:predicted ester cyclase
MSVQENKALARRVFDEVWSQGKLDLADEILTPDFVGRPGGMESMESDRIKHAKEHQGSFAVGLEERARHPEAEPRGRFSTGVEQTGVGKPFKGPAGAKESIGRLREAFPDITFTVEEMIAEGDLVATRWTATGTNDGEFMGHEPTGRQGTIDGMTIQRFENGRIVEGWTQQDALGLLRLIGAVPELTRV